MHKISMLISVQIGSDLAHLKANDRCFIGINGRAEWDPSVINLWQYNVVWVMIWNLPGCC